MILACFRMTETSIMCSDKIAGFSQHCMSIDPVVFEEGHRARSARSNNGLRD